MSVLRGRELEMLRDALVGAYPSRDSFDELLTFRLDKPLELLSSPAEPLPTAVLKTLRWAEAQGRTADLVSAARARNAGNPDLFNVASAIQLALRLPDNVTLESLVNSARSFLDINKWSAGLWEIERRVCAIDLGGMHVGTGFLVGPDAVLTNYHVIASVHRAGEDGGRLQVRFDYKRLRDNTVRQGTCFSLTSDWLIDFSPYSVSDLSDTPTEIPKPTELDYALLKVAGNPSQTRADSDDVTPRGWFSLPQQQDPFLPDSFLLIAQHPSAQPMQLATDDRAIVGMNANQTRVRYRANTLPGSSGSPCFNNQLELTALHHTGDPKYVGTVYGKQNQGIPLQLIRAQIVSRDHAAALSV